MKVVFVKTMENMYYSRIEIQEPVIRYDRLIVEYQKICDYVIEPVPSP